MGDKTRLWTDAFLAALAECGILSQAAEAAGVDRATVWRRRQDDAEFAKACDEAIDMAADKLEGEARRRALEGVEEPVYQGGQLIGTKTVYSDSLLALLLKGRRKRVFAERVETTGADGGPVKTQVLVATGVPSAPLDLADLV
jgi:hypothetical protein